MHSLVLGGNGFIGIHLVRRLLELGTVRIFDRQTDQVEKIFPQAEIIQGKFEQTDFFPLLEGIDVVYHLISTTIPFDGTENAAKELADNVLPTIRLLDAMAVKGTGRIVFVSSAGTIYGETEMPADENHITDPICSYGIGKLCIEKYIALYERYHGLRAITARLTNPYGTGQDPKKRQGAIPIFARAVLTGSLIEIWGDGSTVRDYIHIDDAVNGLVRLAEYDGPYRLFNISSGEEQSLLKIIAMLANKTGKNANVMFKAPRLCDIKRNSVDSSLIRRETGWVPEHTLENSIETLIKSFS